MELNTILIILGVIALIVLIVHGVWANRREKSTFFKNQNNFIDDSRVEKEIIKNQQNMTTNHITENNSVAKPMTKPMAEMPKVASERKENMAAANTQAPSVSQSQNLEAAKVEQTTLKENADPEIDVATHEVKMEVAESKATNLTTAEKIKSLEDSFNNEENLSVEEAVGKIKIRVPKANINKTKNIAELSIAELEASIEDEEEGFNTHTPQIREQLANLSTKNVKLNSSQGDEITSQAEHIAIEPVTQEDIPLKNTVSLAVEDNSLEEKNVTKDEMSNEASEKEQLEKEEGDKNKAGNVVMLYIVAPEGKDFTGEALESCFEKEGFLFGEKQIYHRHADLSSASPILFSLANVQNPGIFDPKTMDDFTTFGVVLFMQLPSTYGNDLINLRLMISTAKAMAKELDGSLLTDQQKLFDQTAEEEYLNRVR